MRPRLFGVVGAVAVASLLAAPVSAAGLQENGWDTFSGTVPDPCTGELIDDVGRVHTVVTGQTSHSNVHFTAVGESSGAAYVDNTSINAVVHAGPGGTFTASFTVYLNLVSMGSSPNQRLIFSDDQVFDSSGNLISETTVSSVECQAADRDR